MQQITSKLTDLEKTVQNEPIRWYTYTYRSFTLLLFNNFFCDILLNSEGLSMKKRTRESFSKLIIYYDHRGSEADHELKANRCWKPNQVAMATINTVDMMKKRITTISTVQDSTATGSSKGSANNAADIYSSISATSNNNEDDEFDDFDSGNIKFKGGCWELSTSGFSWR